MTENQMYERLMEIQNKVQDILDQFDQETLSLNDTMVMLMEQRRCMVHFIEENYQNMPKKLYMDSYITAYALNKTMIKILTEDISDMEDAAGFNITKMVDRRVNFAIDKEYKKLLGGDDNA